MSHKILLALLLLFTLTACTSRTKYGECIGIVDKEDPKLEYDVEWFNVLVAIGFSETIIIPIYTLAKDMKCPISKRNLE